MAAAERIVIPRCIGCGAMHEFERCDAGCHEQHLELVAAGDYDAAVTAEQSARARIDAALPILRELAERRPQPGEWQQAYRELAAEARRALQATGVPAASAGADREAPQQIAVWRCSDCGAVDAPQECLGICIWRRFEWVALSQFEAQQARAETTSMHERRLLGLLGRIAFTTPRGDAWERNWVALSAEAGALFEDIHDTARRTEAHV